MSCKTYDDIVAGAGAGLAYVEQPDRGDQMTPGEQQFCPTQL